MLLPAKMKRIEIITHRDYFDPVMRYLREARLVELLDVKEMLKGYEGSVTPCPTSERLYRLATISSKITGLSNLAQPGPASVERTEVGNSLGEQQIREIENRVSSLEKEMGTLTQEMQTCEKVTQFADIELGKAVQELLEIGDRHSPEGRHRLEEILLRILDNLCPPELEQAEALGDAVQRKTIIESMGRSMADQVTQALETRKGEAAILSVLSQALDLKIAVGSTWKHLRFRPESWIERTRERERQLNAKAQELISQNASWLMVTGEQIDAERMVEEAKGLCGRTESTCVIEGWASANLIPELQTRLSEVSNGRCVVQEWSGKQSPTMLRNPGWTRSFERLTAGFGTPDSREIDPTILWVVTYPLFFGLMFGDVGHGLLFMSLTAGLLFAKKRGTRFQERSFGGLGGLFNLILEGSGLLVLGGAAATVCGFLYGTVFGSEEWFRHLTGLSGPLWFDPFKEPMTFVKVSIIIGIIHISSGLILDIANKVKNRNYGQLLAGPVLWLWFYLTLADLILTHGFRLVSYGLSNLQVVLLLLGVPSVLMLVARVRQVGPFEGFGEWMEAMLASIAHTISYIRIFAMKMIHDVFSLLFLGILLGLPVYLGVPIFSVLTLLMICVLEGAFVFLQDLRLHWVEWFLKFYGGSGTAFRPFGIQRTHTKVAGPAPAPVPLPRAG